MNEWKFAALMPTIEPTSIKYVPGTVIVGDYGEPVLTRGYIEISGVRIYDDQ